MLNANGIVLSRGERAVLNGVDIQLDRQESVILYGSSGSGKTTLLRVLAGLSRPDSGRVSCDGVELLDRGKFSSSFSSKRTDWVWPQVTLVFQDFRLFPALSAYENIVLGLRQNDILERELHGWFEELGVTHCLQRKPRHLSQGEQQRVAILRAIVRQPQYLFLDEPTSALDKQSRDAVMSVLKYLRTTRGTSLLIATHDLEFSSLIGNRFLSIRDGKVHSGSNAQEALGLLSKPVILAGAN